MSQQVTQCTHGGAEVACFAVDHVSTERFARLLMSTIALTHPATDAYRAPEPASSASSDQRLRSLDVLRGLALIFMVLVHFHQLMRLESTDWQGLIGWGVWIGVEEKAWGTFALLFGAGFALLLRRLQARGAAVVPTFVRRLITLFVIGWLIEHAIGFHILTMYAVCGLLLLGMRQWSTRALVRMVVVTVMLPPILNAAVGLVIHFWHSTLPLVRAWWWYVPDESLPLILLGFLAVRLGVAEEPLQHARLIGRWMAYGIAAWAFSWLVLYHVPRPPQYLMSTYWAERTLIGLVQDQWLCLAYAGGALLLLARRPALMDRLRAVEAAGRMAFTNYVLQAVTIWYLAKPLGIKLHEGAYLVAWVALTTLVLALSHVWLGRFRYGPLEWLWRMATYARREPLRLEVHAPALAASPASSRSA